MKYNNPFSKDLPSGLMLSMILLVFNCHILTMNISRGEMGTDSPSWGILIHKNTDIIPHQSLADFSFYTVLQSTKEEMNCLHRLSVHKFHGKEVIVLFKGNILG